MKLVWLEELHELSTVILQSMRDEGTRKKEIDVIDLVTEIADVEVCIMQMKTILLGRQKIVVDHLKYEKIKELPEKLKL